MNKFRKFFSGATAFTLFTVATKMIGAFYRIPLTNIIGAEGIGLYQMVFPLYTVLLTLTSGGITTAVAKYVAAAEAKNSRNAANKTLGVIMKYPVISGGIAGLFIIIFSRVISRIQGNSNVVLPYLGIAPALLFVAITSCFRGYFQGKQNMFPTALSQLVEQTVKLAFGLWLARLLIRRSVAAAVFGATIGVSISELAATAVLIFYYFMSKAMTNRKSRLDPRKLTDIEAAEMIVPQNTAAEPKKKEIFADIYKTAIPSALGSLVLPLTQLMDSVLIVNVLAGMGMENDQATALFGIMNGPINSLINLPIVVTLAISVALLPKIASLFASGKEISEVTLTALKFSSMLAVPCVVIFMFFPESVLKLLYTGGLNAGQMKTAAVLLRLSSVTVFYVSILQVATAVLQAVGKAQVPAINLLIGAAVKIAFTLILLIKMGIEGAAIATVLCYITTTILNFTRFKKLKIAGDGFYSAMVAPIISSGFMALTVWLIQKQPFSSQKLCTIVSLLCGGMVYITLIFLLRAVKKSDIKKMLGT